MLACHGLLSGNAFEKIMNSEFTKVIITNTLECKNDNIPNDKIDIIDVSWMCAEAMRRSHNGESLKELYDPPQPKNLDLNK
jgi:ribose-phosphate pyrophosphokinase